MQFVILNLFQNLIISICYMLKGPQIKLGMAVIGQPLPGSLKDLYFITVSQNLTIVIKKQIDKKPEIIYEKRY